MIEVDALNAKRGLETPIESIVYANQAMPIHVINLKEKDMLEIPKIEVDRCVGCSQCVDVCVAHTLLLNPKTKKVELVDEGRSCMSCGHCTAVCPTSALSLYGLDIDVEREQFESASPLESLLVRDRSTRSYRSDPLDKKTLMEVINVTRFSPSAMNQRPLHFTVIGRKTMEPISKIAAKAFAGHPRYGGISASIEKGNDVLFRGAPHIIIISADSDIQYAAPDATIAGRDIDLYATERGLGTFWCGLLHNLCTMVPEVFALCKLPEKHVVHACIGLGTPKIKFSRPPARRMLEEGRDITFNE
uniref:Nitroreductase Fd-NR2 n=2 Tax=Giardia muris TaxID=5742 RepID=A0A3S7RNE7_GIAMU|nr:Nitroreductase Fd-NR2 [Giardia muris]